MIGLVIGCVLAYFIFRLSAALNCASMEVADLMAENATLYDQVRELKAQQSPARYLNELDRKEGHG